MTIAREPSGAPPLTNAMLDADEIARRMSVSRATAYREMRNMLHVVIGKRTIRVSEAAFDAYVRRRSAAPPAPSGNRIRAVQPRTLPRTPRSSSSAT